MPEHETREKTYHRELASYFLGKPLLVGDDNAVNSRKCLELPYQLLMANMWEDAYDVLTDLSFIQAKIESGNSYDLYVDFRHALNTLPIARDYVQRNRERLLMLAQTAARRSSGSLEAFRTLGDPTPRRKRKRPIQALPTVPNAIGRAKSRRFSPELQQFLTAFEFVEANLSLFVKYYRLEDLVPAQIELIECPTDWKKAPGHSPNPTMKTVSIRQPGSTPILSYVAAQRGIRDVAIDFAASRIASAGNDGSVWVFSVKSFSVDQKVRLPPEILCVREVRKDEFLQEPGYSSPGKKWRGRYRIEHYEVNGVWLSPDGRRLLLMNLRDGGAYAANGRKYKSFRTHGLLAASPSGTFFLARGGLCHRDIRSGASDPDDRQRSSRYHPSEKAGRRSRVVDTGFLSEQGDMAVFVGYNRLERQMLPYDRRPVSLAVRLPDSGECRHYADITPDAGWMVAVEAGSAVKLVQIKTMSAIRRLQCPEADIACIRMTEDHRYCVVGHASGRIRMLDLSRGGVVRDWQAHTGSIVCIDATPDLRHVVSCGADGTVNLWDTQKIPRHATNDMSVTIQRREQFLDETLELRCSYDQSSLLLFAGKRRIATVHTPEGVMQGTNLVFVYFRDLSVLLVQLGEPEEDGGHVYSYCIDCSRSVATAASITDLPRLSDHGDRTYLADQRGSCTRVHGTLSSDLVFAVADHVSSRQVGVVVLQDRSSVVTRTGWGGIFTAHRVETGSLSPDGALFCSAGPGDYPVLIWPVHSKTFDESQFSYAPNRKIDPGCPLVLQYQNSPISRTAIFIYGFPSISPEFCTSVAFSPSGRWLIVSHNFYFYRLDLVTRLGRMSITDDRLQITHLVPFPDDLHALLVLSNGCVQIVDFREFSVIRTLRVPAPVSDIRFVSDLRIQLCLDGEDSITISADCVEPESYICVPGRRRKILYDPKWSYYERALTFTCRRCGSLGIVPQRVVSRILSIYTEREIKENDCAALKTRPEDFEHHDLAFSCRRCGFPVRSTPYVRHCINDVSLLQHPRIFGLMSQMEVHAAEHGLVLRRAQALLRGSYTMDASVLLLYLWFLKPESKTLLRNLFQGFRKTNQYIEAFEIAEKLCEKKDAFVPACTHLLLMLSRLMASSEEGMRLGPAYSKYLRYSYEAGIIWQIAQRLEKVNEYDACQQILCSLQSRGYVTGADKKKARSAAARLNREVATGRRTPSRMPAAAE